MLLVDGCGAPLAAVLETDLLPAVRSELAGFFRAVEPREACLRFLFITGVTKLPASGPGPVFSTVSDISCDPDCAAILGFTGDGIRQYFSGWLAAAARGKPAS